METTRTAPTTARARGRRLPYVGALDGLRAICLIAVMCYHGTFSWAPGGFLGVSTFFTLSGFLITALMLIEVRGGARLDMGRFWAARARRLLPAAAITLLLVIVFARAAASSTQLTGLRQDLWASFGLSVNWRLALSGRAYGGYAAQASPVQHFWSLAVEEQFYLFLPLVVVAGGAVARRLGRPLRQVLGVGAAVLTVASAGAMLAAVRSGGDITWAYYATHTRAAELLAGVVLACVTHRLVGWRHRRRVVPIGGAVGAAVLVGSWLTVDQTDRYLYSGGFLVYTAASVAVIVACLYSSPVRTALDTAPLRWIGRISYGAYLYHWPLFSWLDAGTVGLSGYPLFGVQVAATLALAWASARFVELPIRRGQLLSHIRPPALAGAFVFALVLTLLVPWRTSDTGPSGVDVAEGQQVAPAAAAPVAAIDPPPPDAPRIERLLLVGDSVPQQLAPYVAGALPDVDVRWIGRAGIGPLSDQGRIGRDLDRAISEFDPDVVLFHFAGSYTERQPDAGPFFVDGHEVEDGSEEMFEQWAIQVDELVARAGSRGATVLWGLVPTIDPDNFFGYLADTVERFNDGYRALQGVTVLDWHRLTEGPQGGFTDLMTGPDGVPADGRADDGLHFTAFGNGILASTVVTALDGWPGRQPPDQAAAAPDGAAAGPPP